MDNIYICINHAERTFTTWCALHLISPHFHISYATTSVSTNVFRLTILKPQNYTYHAGFFFIARPQSNSYSIRATSIILRRAQLGPFRWHHGGCCVVYMCVWWWWMRRVEGVTISHKSKPKASSLYLAKRFRRAKPHRLYSTIYTRVARLPSKRSLEPPYLVASDDDYDMNNGCLEGTCLCVYYTFAWRQRLSEISQNDMRYDVRAARGSWCML